MESEPRIAIRGPGSYFPAVRVLTWIPIVALLLLLGMAWVAFRSERPFTFEFDEPPAANTLADPLVVGIALGEETLSGTVLTEAGRPVREALVKLQRGVRLLFAYSDAEGHFRIPGVDPGEHALTVVARGHLPVVFQALAGETPVKLRLGAPIANPPAVPASEQTDLHLTLQSLTDDGDTSRLELVLEPLDDDILASPTFPRLSPFATDGACTVPGLAHGRYRALVIPHWAHGGTWPDLLTDLDGPGRVIEHPADGDQDLELRAGEIRGRITDIQTHVSQGVEFIGGALIIVRPATAGTEPDARIWPPAQTDEQGTFLVRDLPPGRYLVTVHVGDRRIEREVTVYAAATTTLDL
ncbi:MAG: hypothetical protein ACI8QZ_001714 [Chlamydiales bacterium]|jgi:hypothetical protein